MRVLIDACVLYPTVMREIVMAVAARGLFTPLWSPRILEEWARAAAKLGETDALVARGEIAVLRAAWPKAEVTPDDALARTLWLPDPDDVHVLAAAISGDAGIILTLNLKDFPKGQLAEHGLAAVHPDAFLRDLYDSDPAGVAEAAEMVRQTAETLSKEPQPMRRLLKKARLPRLAKALG